MQLMCRVYHFPKPYESLFCCLKTRDCECPRRMGVCEDEIIAQELGPENLTPTEGQHQPDCVEPQHEDDFYIYYEGDRAPPSDSN